MLREYSTEWSAEFLALLTRWYAGRRVGVGPLLYQFESTVWEYSSAGIGTGSTPTENRIRRVSLESLYEIVQQQELELLRKPVESVMITVEERREA